MTSYPSVETGHIALLQTSLQEANNEIFALRRRLEAQSKREIDGYITRSHERDTLARTLRDLLKAMEGGGSLGIQLAAATGIVRDHYNAHGWPTDMFFLYQTSGDTDGRGIRPMLYTVREFRGSLSAVKAATELLNDSLPDGGDMWVYAETDPR